MKKAQILVIPSLIVLGIMAEGLGSNPYAQSPGETHSAAVKISAGIKASVPNEILVTFRPSVPLERILAMIESQGMTILEMNQELAIYRLRVSGSIENAVAYAQSQPSVEDARPNYILAEVAGETITLLDIESAIQQVPPPLRQIYTTGKAKETLLRTLLNNKVFSKAAKEENLDESPAVRRKIEAAIEWTLAQEFRTKVLEHISISEKELRDYYEDYHWIFQTPEQIKIRQIVVETEAEAVEILLALEAGAEFEKMARERSVDATAQLGGELGWVGRGRLDPALEQTGFVLKEGEISDIIKTPSGFHIITVEGKRSARQKPFSEARNQIEQTLREQKRKENAEQKREELEQRYGVKLHSEFLSDIKVRPTGEAGQGDPLRTPQEMVEKPY